MNDKEFTKTVLAEKVDTGKYPEGTKFTFTEINYEKDGNVNGKHNEDLKEKSQHQKKCQPYRVRQNNRKHQLFQVILKNLVPQ